MKLLLASVLLVSLAGLGGCAKHDCKLESDAEKSAFGDIAPMTKGAFSCFSRTEDNMGMSKPHLELAATFGDSSIDKVTDQYKSFLDKNGWTTTVEPHTGKRGNGKTYEGKMLLAKKGDRQVGAIIYGMNPDEDGKAKAMIDTTIAPVDAK